MAYGDKDEIYYHDGVVEDSDGEGGHMTSTAAGSTWFNPDGSGMARDAQGHQTTWDADGNFTEVDPIDTSRFEDASMRSGDAGLSAGDGEFADSTDGSFQAGDEAGVSM
jgi:hypothetical protein